MAAGLTAVKQYWGQRPSEPPAEVAKRVAEDARALIRAEIDLAKAEVAAGLKAKAMGTGTLVAAAVAAWLGLQALLVTAGFALALVVPGWAAAGIVTLALFLLAGIAGLIGKRLLATPVSLDTTKHNVEEDVAWTKAHLSKD